VKIDGYANNIKLVKLKRTRLVLGFLSLFLLLGLFISPSAAKTDWKISPSNPTVGDTLKITGTASPEEELIAKVSFEKELPVTEGRYQYLLEKIKIPRGEDNHLTVRGEGVENLNVSVTKLFFNKKVSSNASGGIATISRRHVPPLTYKVLIDGDALSTPSKDFSLKASSIKNSSIKNSSIKNSPINDSSIKLTVTASQTLKTNPKGKFRFNYHTSSMPAGKYTIYIGNSKKIIELKPKKNK